MAVAIYTIVFCAVAGAVGANIFKGSPENFPVTEENAIKVRNALLSVVVSNSAAFQIHQLLTENNVVFSPLSVTDALALLYLGSSEETAAEMEDILGFNSTFLHDGLLSIRKAMGDEMADCEAHSLSFANALVFCSNHSVVKDFEQAARFYYSSDVLTYEPETKPEDITQMVNIWVSNATRGKINNVMNTCPTSDSLTMVNALYFKAPWKYPFDPAKTVKKPFYNFGYKSQGIPTMHRTVKALYGYHPEVDAFVLELPYSGLDVDCIFLLPRQRSGLHKLETSMNIEVYNTLQQVMYSTEVEIAVPKFRLSNSIELPHILRSIGVQGLFSGGANLSGISPENFYVSQLIHKTAFDVTEAGTEAASSSRATVQTLSLKPTFYLNHPFMFIVKHRWTGAILFCGRVQKL